MAYIVLALGAILSIGGAISIFHGANIVEVERGWTGVIAGATSLTGGIITIALGFILKTLLDMRRNGSAVGGGVMPGALLPLPVEVGAHPGGPRPAIGAEPSDLDRGLLAAFLAPKETTSAYPAEAEDSLPSRHPSPAVQAGVDHELPEPTPRSDEPDEGRTIAEPEAPQPEKSRFKISFKKPAPPSPPALEPEAPEQTTAPAMDDWLDRAFSDLDGVHGTATAPQPTHTEPGPLRTAPDKIETAHSEVGHALPHHGEIAEAEPAAPPAAQPGPEPAAMPSAVIGRYEADGTSYVMFADGSIEAQSEAGVYRFKSMTELKSFIEGTG